MKYTNDEYNVYLKVKRALLLEGCKDFCYRLSGR